RSRRAATYFRALLPIGLGVAPRNTGRRHWPQHRSAYRGGAWRQRACRERRGEPRQPVRHRIARDTAGEGGLMEPGHTPPEQRERILVIEDERPMRVGLMDALAREGYRVLAAEDGESGLARAL